MCVQSVNFIFDPGVRMDEEGKQMIRLASRKRVKKKNERGGIVEVVRTIHGNALKLSLSLSMIRP